MYIVRFFLTLRFNLFIMSSIMAICMMFCRKFLIQMPRPLVHHGTDKKKLIDGVMCPAALFCCNAVTFWRGFVIFPPTMFHCFPHTVMQSIGNLCLKTEKNFLLCWFFPRFYQKYIFTINLHSLVIIF